MNTFTNNIPLVVFTSMFVGLVFGWRLGILDGRQREQKDQANRNRIQRELRWEHQKHKVK